MLWNFVFSFCQRNFLFYINETTSYSWAKWITRTGSLVPGPVQPGPSKTRTYLKINGTQLIKPGPTLIIPGPSLTKPGPILKTRTHFENQDPFWKPEPILKTRTHFENQSPFLKLGPILKTRTSFENHDSFRKLGSMLDKNTGFDHLLPNKLFIRSILRGPHFNFVY